MRYFLVAALVTAGSLVANAGRLHAQQADASCPPPTCKICVSEPKHQTRTVYSTKAEEYCLPSCSLLSLLHGHCGCDSGPCGGVRVRQRLVVKKVPGCDTTQCVPRAVPAACPAP